MISELTGTGVALVTPFNEDLNIDTDSLADLVENNISQGIDYFVILGTTGESVTLNKEEKQLVINTIIEANKGRKPLVLGVGGNNTAAVVNTLNGVDSKLFTAILSVSPSYNRPTQRGIYRHFAEIASASPLPVILYNVPARTGVNIDPATVLQLASDFHNIVGIKEAAASMVQLMRLIKEKSGAFMVISGDDILALPVVAAGGSGVISVTATAIPRSFSQMIRLGLKGENQKAWELHYEIMPLIDLVFEEGNPAGIKALLHHKKLIKNFIRLPLVTAGPDLIARLARQSDALERKLQHA